MSSNCNVDITRPFNDIDLAGKYFVKSSDFFDIIRNIEERLERLAIIFLDFNIEEIDKDHVTAALRSQRYVVKA